MAKWVPIVVRRTYGGHEDFFALMCDIGRANVPYNKYSYDNSRVTIVFFKKKLFKTQYMWSL